MRRTLPPKLLFHVFAVFLIFLASFTHAAKINFDDIKRVYDPVDPSWADQPITGEYLAKGLFVDGGYLNEYFEEEVERFVSGPNYLQGGPYFSLTFVGKLPSLVTMVVSSSHDDKVYLNALCGDGSNLLSETPGWAGPDDNSPFKAKNLITFNSAAGITRIDISAYYFLRTSAMIDDLEFHYEVPEPTPFLLLAIGGLLIALRRKLLV